MVTVRARRREAGAVTVRPEGWVRGGGPVCLLVAVVAAREVPLPMTVVPPLTARVTPEETVSVPLLVVNVAPVLVIVSAYGTEIMPVLVIEPVMVRLPPFAPARLLIVPVLLRTSPE